MIIDGQTIQELQHLKKPYEMGKVEPMLNKEMNQVSRKRRLAKELHLSTQIGDCYVDYMVHDLGSEVNVMNKQTWTYMGMPTLI